MADLARAVQPVDGCTLHSRVLLSGLSWRRWTYPDGRNSRISTFDRGFGILETVHPFRAESHWDIGLVTYTKPVDGEVGWPRNTVDLAGMS